MIDGRAGPDLDAGDQIAPVNTYRLPDEHGNLTIIIQLAGGKRAVFTP